MVPSLNYSTGKRDDSFMLFFARLVGTERGFSNRLFVCALYYQAQGNQKKNKESFATTLLRGEKITT